MPFTVTECTVTKNSITIAFSDPVNSSASDIGALNPANYTIYNPAAGFSVPTNPDSTWNLSLTGQTVTITLPTSMVFNPGDYVLVGISNIALSSDPAITIDPVSLVRQVPGSGQIGRITRDVEDAISYPILTEEIGYRSSPVGIPTGGGASGSGIGGLGQVAAKAVSEVLGWKPNSADPKGFLGALTQAFTLTDIEGHVESTWTPRTYAVQTDLGGGITGAQASLYMRAKNALDSALPLLDGLYPLDPEADPEYVKALREMARSQMTEIIKELGTVGLPSILRIDTYFGILLGQNPAQLPATGVMFDPDEIEGTLGQLRDTYGIYFVGNKFNNSVEDEQDITNFRVISDYMTSLMQSWIANRQFFFVNPGQQAFFGTQLVLISRQFTTISETVNEVRFALDSVFIGPSERQTLLLRFADTTLAPMFLEDVLGEVERFFQDEASRLLRDGGKISVTNNILPVARSLQNMIEEAHVPVNIDELPDGFKTARVRNSLDDLQDQIEALIDLIEQVEQEVPPSEDKLTIAGVVQRPGSTKPYTAVLSVFGTGFESDTEVGIHSTVPMVQISKEFFSAERIDVTFDPNLLETGIHEITVINPDGESAILRNAFTISKSGGAKTVAPNTPVAKPRSGTGRARAFKSRYAGIEVSGRLVQPTLSPVKQVPDPNVQALKGSVDQLHESHKEITLKLHAVMEKLTVFETIVKEKKSKKDD